jgi:hypothetical protein
MVPNKFDYITSIKRQRQKKMTIHVVYPDEASRIEGKRREAIRKEEEDCCDQIVCMCGVSLCSFAVIYLIIFSIVLALY